MDEDYVESLVKKALELLPHKKGTSQFDLEQKASTFLLLVTRLAQARYEVEQDLVKLTTIQAATFAAAIENVNSELKVTEKKAKAQTNKAYTTAREELESLTAKITYIKTIQSVMDNAHIFYRNCAKINS